MSLDLSKNLTGNPQYLREIYTALESTNQSLVFLKLEPNIFRSGQQPLEIEGKINFFLNRNFRSLFRAMENLSKNFTLFADMGAEEVENYGLERYKAQFTLYKKEMEVGLKKLRVIAQPAPFSNIKEKLERLRKQCEQKVSILSGGGALPVTVDEPITTHLAKVPTSLEIPIEKLKFGGKIGEGSFGVVYRGSYLHTEVAIKTLKPTNDSRLQEGFLREMEILAATRSPHIVLLLGIGELPHGEGYAIVTEFMPKGSLSAYLYSTVDIPWQRRFPMARGVICALEFLHHHRICHRDLKSDNVMLTGDYQVKLIDFGFAKCAEQSQKYPALQEEGIVGTPLHWSPEILEQVYKKSLKSSEEFQPEMFSYGADIFSLGVLLNQIASRLRPYARVSSIKGMNHLIHHVVTQDRRDEIPPNTPLFFSANIKDCWRKAAADRPTASELIDAHDKGVASLQFS